jgi:hypothetical protein
MQCFTSVVTPAAGWQAPRQNAGDAVQNAVQRRVDSMRTQRGMFHAKLAAMFSAGVMQDAQVLWDFHQMPYGGRATDIEIGLGSHDIGAAEHAADLYQKGRFPVVVFHGSECAYDG